MPGRLYIKIFLSFIAVLLVAMIMVVILFRFTEGGKFVGRIKQFARAQVVLVRTIIEEHTLDNNNSVESKQELVDLLGEVYQAKVWITDSSGNPIAQSFPGLLPVLNDLELVNDDPEDDRLRRLEGVEVSRCDGERRCIYATIPFGGKRGINPGVLHYLYNDPSPDKHEEVFLFGLLGIGMAVALLIMPVSFVITRRLDTLRGVAHRIADGDLSCRANICGRDEVAKVGWAINRMADSLSRMIRGSKELTANVSHELRTPLTRIRIAEEILRERFGEEGAAHLDSIREDVDSLDHIIGRLLELSKLDLREHSFTLEAVDVIDMVESVADHLDPIAHRNGLTTSLDLPSEAIIQADGEALYHAFQNIMENGVKHASLGGTLSMTAISSDTDLTLVMENTHGPLLEEELETIFEPFRRAKGVKPQGTGLGLAIAKKVIEGHNGSIRAENGDGTVRFVVVLPVEQ